MFGQAIWEHYRCPESFLDMVPGGTLFADEGYFRFGPNAVCYGRSCRGTRRARPEYELDDLVAHTWCDDAKLSLPFDPTEIIDNLRLERYANCSLTGYEKVLKKIYYRLRLFTNRTARRQIQRFRVRNWQERSFPRWPVDTTVENICESLLLLSLEAKGMERIPFIWFWPRGARGCVTMTHDVETETGRDWCADLMDLDDTFGVKASFQIVPEKRYQVTPKFLESIRNRGFEIGLHDLNHDGRLFDDRKEFLLRAMAINEYGRNYGARGFRSAVLYRKPEWLDALDFSYDTSIPNVAHLDPQRGGCCTVFPYFLGAMLEIPVTTIQDYTLFHLLNEYSIDLWRTQTNVILEKNGLASFIVHPDYVMDAKPKSVYQDLLGYFSELRRRGNIWFALPMEVDCWWRTRSKLALVPDGTAWRIKGKGAERAVLAFARNVNGRLEYEVAQTRAR